ncbi:class I SAM-dependent methyltransferase, partial [bacterium]|nr:class I SAM-dependent methyltransferase [bacterium]
QTAPLVEKATTIFAAHLLEHLRDPRGFLRAVASMLVPEGRLFIEVPDAENADPALVGPINLINQQHIQYFSARSLTRMAETCGFDVVATRRMITGRMPRLQCVLRRSAPPAVAVAVTGNLAVLKRRRAVLAEMAIGALNRGEAVGLWGLGADFRRLLDEHPQLRLLVAAEK